MHAIDALRGVAVVAMIVWHTADAWLLEAARGTDAFAVTRFVGGLAAPAFLLLAGLSLALAAPERLDRAWALVAMRRAARVVLAGYALNLWSWAVDRGGVLDRVNRPIIGGALLAIALAAVALRERPLPARSRAILALATAIVAYAIALALGGATRGGTWVLPRLDVLHGIGAALIGTTLVLHALRDVRARGRAMFAIAIAISALSVIVIGAPQRVMPAWMADWIARGAPWPMPTSSGFPLFPWLAYSVLGAAVGHAMRGIAPRTRWALPRIERPFALAAIAIAVALATWEPMPSARVVLDRAGWLRSLFRLVFNGSMIAALAALVAATPLDRGRDALALVGRSSLLVYAVHLEFAFGLAGVPLRQALGWPLWALGCTALIAAMIGVAWLAERWEEKARARARERVHATA